MSTSIQVPACLQIQNSSHELGPNLASRLMGLHSCQTYSICTIVLQMRWMVRYVSCRCTQESKYTYLAVKTEKRKATWMNFTMVCLGELKVASFELSLYIASFGTSKSTINSRLIVGINRQNLLKNWAGAKCGSWYIYQRGSSVDILIAEMTWKWNYTTSFPKNRTNILILVAFVGEKVPWEKLD